LLPNLAVHHILKKNNRQEREDKCPESGLDESHGYIFLVKEHENGIDNRAGKSPEGKTSQDKTTKRKCKWQCVERENGIEDGERE
jgi:hypothetical protein